MKRLLSCYASDIVGATKEELKQSILSSEGRILMGETVVTAAPLIAGVTNAEMMAAFGCDLLVLNELDVFHPEIVDFYDCDNPIAEIKRLTGRLVGINLEPVDTSQEVQDQQFFLKPGRQVSPESLRQAQVLGVDFIMLTGNPATGVSMAAIRSAIGLAKEHFEGLIFAGKMHGAGLGESVVDSQALLDFVELGADGVLIPAVGTVPGVLRRLWHLSLVRSRRVGLWLFQLLGPVRRVRTARRCGSLASATSGWVRTSTISEMEVTVGCQTLKISWLCPWRSEASGTPILK